MRLNRLSDLGVKKSKPGSGGKDKLYGDGGGLWLRVTGAEAAPARSWLFRYERKGKARRMGLGAYPDISLQAARERAQGLRRLLADGKDPFEERRAQAKAAVLAAAKHRSFMDCAKDYIDAQRAGWSEKHASDWETSLKMHAAPAFEGLSVQEIERDHVVKALRPIWETKTETATRVRGRIEAVLSWAAVAGYRTGENPALWKGNLDHMLVKPSKIQVVEHHPALPYSEVASFMTALRDENGTAARALEFAILNATRTMEIRLADWSEVDWAGKMWIIPGPHIKMKKEHRVPLSDRAMAVLREMGGPDSKGYIFPGAKPGEPLSTMAMLMLLRRMGHDNITVHGFRSTFKDWASERTSYPREVSEMSLAHAIGDKVEAAYRRGELLDKRRRLMAQWAQFCWEVQVPGGSVRTLRGV